jgi:hypothetical protein
LSCRDKAIMQLADTLLGDGGPPWITEPISSWSGCVGGQDLSLITGG